MDAKDPQLERARLEHALETLGELLKYRSLRMEVAVIGGTGLLLLGAVVRTTTDVDLVACVEGGQLRSATPLPPQLQEAANDVARALDLSPRWLNPGPTALLDFGLPRGFLGRCHVFDYGGLVAHVAARYDQIHFKLYAAADQGPRSKHMSDLRSLAPTREELQAAARWCRTQDPSDGFLSSLLAALGMFAVEDFDEAQ
jgi:hypothetical protein